MSFSFAVRGASIAAVLPLAKAEIEKVIAQQPLHSYDAPSVIELAERYLALASEPNEGSEITLNLHGSVWFFGDGVLGGLSGGVNISYGPALAKVADAVADTLGDSDGDDGA